MDVFGAIASIIKAVVDGVASIGIVPFVIAFVTLAGFIGFDRLSKSRVSQQEREGNIALKVLNDAAEDRKRHYEEREYERKQEERQGQRLDKFEALIKELSESVKSLKVAMNDLDERLRLVMKMYEEKPS